MTTMSDLYNIAVNRLENGSEGGNCTLEEVARDLLHDALEIEPKPRNLAEIADRLFGPENGVDIELPPRKPTYEPPTID